MKTLLVCLVLSAFTASVKCGGGGDGGFGFFGFGGFDSSSEDGGFNGGKCTCRGWWNPCRGVVGSLVLGCPNTNSFLQCNGATCSNQTCPSGQVWNKTQNACAACAPGMHVATNLQVCVCDQGKTFRNRTCVDCPTDSIQEPDRCYCNGTKIFDKLKNACRDCPAGSTLDSWSRRCQCTNTTQIWSDADWACKDCPGEWLPKRTRRPFWSPSSRCTCTGTNQVFDRQTVTCYTCPTGTTASRDNANCLCSDRFKFFNWTTKQCDCAKGLIPDPAGGTGCVRPAVTTSTTTANPANPGSP